MFSSYRLQASEAFVALPQQTIFASKGIGLKLADFQATQRSVNLENWEDWTDEKKREWFETCASECVKGASNPQVFL